ncbi:hypothetical protein AB0903_08255 [Streptomyces sp. NPDC048389]|uniref:hypothetical protein n=1 Tax=Streptomyces sp. NPDC048389 TaxID=3154622 RepID=UPI003452730F
MAQMTAPTTPTVAIARELRRLGLAQGAGKDFRVAGHYVNGERHHTYVLLLTRHANEVVAANADLIEERTGEGPFPFRVSVRYFGTDRPTASIANGGSRVRETPAAAEEPAPAVEEAPAAAPAVPAAQFRTGDIVAVDGRPGDWELMAPAGDAWEVEPAQAGGRERTTVPAAALRPLADAPHVRRGDLVMQNYAEQWQAAVVGDVYRLGRWVAVKTRPADEHGPAWSMLDDVETLVVVTAEQVESAVRLDVEAGDHRGRIVQAVVTRHAGKFRVTCSCKDGLEVCRIGRQVGWCSSLEAARELWEWHAAGSVGTAPADRLPAPAAPAPLPASETPGEELPTPHAPAEQLQIPAPAVDYREQCRQEEQAKGLGWSTRHADAVRWAAAGELLRAEDGSARRVAPGRVGRRVAAALVPPLVAAGFLADVEQGGVTRIEPTPDGRRALLVWDLHRPEPVERPRKKEGLPLRPLLGGQEAARRSAAFRADEERRRVERERWYGEFEQRQAAEAWEDRLWDAWARVAGITYRLGRKRPPGWAPTDEEARLHGLDAEVVAALRAEAPAAVEDEGHPADGEQPRRHPDTPHASLRCNLTLQCKSASIGVSGRADSPTRKGNGHEPHDPDYRHRGRRRDDRRADDRVIAEGGHEGHDLETVGRIITSDTVLDTIRTAYDRRIAAGATPKDAVTAVGQSLIAHYCNSAGIPTAPAAPADAEEIATDPAGVPHRAHGTCTATWRRVPVNRNRPELGTTTEFGHKECREPATVDRFVQVAQSRRYRPVYACPAHASN